VGWLTGIRLPKCPVTLAHRHGPGPRKGRQRGRSSFRHQKAASPFLTLVSQVATNSFTPRFPICSVPDTCSSTRRSLWFNYCEKDAQVAALIKRWTRGPSGACRQVQPLEYDLSFGIPLHDASAATDDLAVSIVGTAINGIDLRVRKQEDESFEEVVISAEPGRLMSVVDVEITSKCGFLQEFCVPRTRPPNSCDPHPRHNRQSLCRHPRHSEFRLTSSLSRDVHRPEQKIDFLRITTSYRRCVASSSVPSICGFRRPDAIRLTTPTLFILPSILIRTR
jgi:hypothetical protein